MGTSTNKRKKMPSSDSSESPTRAGPSNKTKKISIPSSDLSEEDVSDVSISCSGSSSTKSTFDDYLSDETEISGININIELDYPDNI